MCGCFAGMPRGYIGGAYALRLHPVGRLHLWAGAAVSGALVCCICLPSVSGLVSGAIRSTGQTARGRRPPQLSVLPGKDGLSACSRVVKPKVVKGSRKVVRES